MTAYAMSSRSPWQYDPSYDSSPPRTPTRSVKYRSAAPKKNHGRLANRPSFPETFLDDITPVDANQQEDSGDDERDPHDLSLSPQHGTRSSVVDNMLLSLDQFSENKLITVDDPYHSRSQEPDPFPFYSSHANSRLPRHRGHTFSSSLSSDIEAFEESSARFTSRGRRSNSSSNFPPTVRKVDGSDCGVLRSRVFEAQRATMAKQSSQQHEKDIHGSDSSGLDLAQMLAVGRPSRARRSISFDYGINGSAVSPIDHTMLQYDDANAAPTPNVPAGPRRTHSPALKDYTIPQQAAAGNSRPSALSRRGSTKSARSLYAKKGRSDTLGTTTLRGRHEENRHFWDIDPPEVPPIPNHVHIPAPSPTIAFQKPAQVSPVPEASTPPPLKERYGFFRRVFGSYKSSSPTQAEKTQSFSRDNDLSARPRESQSAPNSSKGGAPAAQQNNGRDNTHVVTKKPSSFFRRRKKSTTDRVPPPLLIPNSNLKHTHTAGNREVEPSPAGSPSLVMKQYHEAPPSPSLDGPNASIESVQNTKLETEARTKPSLTYRSHGEPVGKTRPPVDNNSQPSPNTTTKFVKPNSSLGIGFRDRDGSPTGNETVARQDSGDISKRPRTSPTPEAAPPNIVKGPKNKQQLRVATAAPKSFASTSLQELEKSHSELALPESKTERPKLTTISSEGVTPPVSATTMSSYQTAYNTPLMTPAEESNSNLGRKATASTSPILESANEATDDSSVRLSSADRERAQALFDETDENSRDELSATWLGIPTRAGIRKAFMNLFSWSDINILASLRGLCSKIALKGETQQVDRVLDAFSSRWCECNPNHGFKASDVVHTISYSLLLLNTDLHLADIEQKMTRAQFIRNTMPTIQRVVADAAPGAFEANSSSNKPHNSRSTEDNSLPSDETESDVVSNLPSKNQDQTRKAQPVSSIPTISTNDVSISGSSQLVNTSVRGTTKKAWETQVEIILKDFYNSIQKNRLPLRGIQPEPEDVQPSNNFLSLTSNMLRRTPSTISRATASDVFSRGRPTDNRLSTARWTSKGRSRGRMYPPSTMTSSRTSLDDQSVWSPTASSTWSKASLGKTLTSVSVDSLGSDYPRGDYQQSIGFANALSHAIIREDSASCVVGSEDANRAEWEDETLELAGAPWAKEGNVKHKHHLDSVDKRAKDRNWNESFAVIQRGWMRLFSFNTPAKSTWKKKQKQNGGVVVGGGNWMENADETWKFLLRHTIASALPQPGYSKARPYVWALSLPTGAVHLFQAGTPEIVKEFVSTANYWSARLSKEPMFGGISNIEYGWSNAVINQALAHVDDHKPPCPSGTRASIQSSIRSSIDQQNVRPRLPADRIHISDWMPPQQSMIASTVEEGEQLNALRTYVKYVEEELKRHNELRSAMVLAFTPRHPNASKALANWERKSSYLLREIVKFRTYIDCLQTAHAQKEKFYATSNVETEQTKTEPQVQVSCVESPVLLPSL